VLREPEGYRRECTRAKNLGPSVRWAVYPSQLDTANGVFSPIQEEADRALEVAKAYEEAKDKGLGAVENDGDTVDAASVRSLRNTMQNTASLGM
jgi:citrate lyase subunit beta/citryl-CoA lyase